MYGDYWKLSRLPFENSCDPLFFFRGRSHEAALLKLQYVIEQSKGVAVLVGEHGTGKTYVSRVLESELATSPDEDETSTGPVVRLMFPRLSADATLSYLVGGLTASPVTDGTSRDVLVRQLEAALRDHAAAGRRPTFIIDDAHLIEDSDVLQMLAQVVAYCEAHALPLSNLLLGQPHLLPQIHRLPALSSRVAVRAALHPLTESETAAYIQHRLKVAGLEANMFDDSALESFHRLTQGFPRRINQLCDLTLLVGYADELPSLSRTDVEAAAEELVTVATG